MVSASDRYIPKNASERLYIHGFLSHGSPDLSLSAEKRRAKLKRASKDEKADLLKQVSQETLEVADGMLGKTEYPKPAATFRLVYEAPNASLEENYFWILEHLRQDRGYPYIVKLLDLYAASESSAFWGNQQQRIAAQQNNASSFLATVGKMVKEVFQIVREIRIIEERLDMYKEWRYVDKEGKVHKSDSADVTLKSLFTDQVEGGTKNPQSVFGLAQTVGFTILPDLFFNTRVYSTDELEKVIEKMDYNTSVKNVLRRKLYQFLIWKERTHKELESRYRFNIKYLQQHWASVQMYMGWIKPYLRNVQRLQMKQGLQDDAELIASFDQSITEVEFIARSKQSGASKSVLVTFRFRTRPEMAIRKEYQQGPAHMGRMEMFIRAYGWDDEDIENYKRMRGEEEIAMLTVLDKSLESVMDALGEEFLKYLEKKEEELDEPAEKEETAYERAKTDLKVTLDPFLSVFGGFKELFGPFVPSFEKKKGGGGGSKNKEDIAKGAMGDAFLTWNIYKKAHRMMTW